MYTCLPSWTPVDHLVRQDARYDSQELRPPPAKRTHTEAVAQGLACDAYHGAECHHPRTQHGINGSTPFAHLPLFDIIRDLCPDMMHVVVNLFKHWIPLLAGTRVPKKSKKFNRPTMTLKPPTHDKYCKRTQSVVPNTRYHAQLEAYQLARDEHRRKVKKYEAEVVRLQQAQDVVGLFALSENGTHTHTHTVTHTHTHTHPHTHNVNIMLTLC
jgi:hypothetical protein